jgi:hypothetical protein
MTSGSALVPTQPPIKWIPEGGLSDWGLGVANHLHPFIAKIKNAWSWTSTPHTSSQRGI